MDKSGNEESHRDSSEIASLHESEWIGCGENARHSDGNEHFHGEIEEFQGGQPHSLHSLFDEFQWGGRFRGEHTDSIGEGDESDVKELEISVLLEEKTYGFLMIS